MPSIEKDLLNPGLIKPDDIVINPDDIETVDSDISKDSNINWKYEYIKTARRIYCDYLVQGKSAGLSLKLSLNAADKFIEGVKSKLMVNE